MADSDPDWVIDEGMDPEEVLEGVSEPAEGVPTFGRDLTPTKDQIARGAHGNGSWNLTDESVQLAQEKVHQQKKDMLDQRRKFFDEAARDALKDAISFHQKLIELGNKVLAKIEAGDELVTSSDLQVLAKAQKSAQEVTDRGIGKSKQVTEHTENKTILGMFINKDEA